MSTPDLTNQQKLEEIYKLTLENNHILHKLQNRMRMGTVIRIVYWLAILGALGGVYYYIRPILETVASTTTQTENMFNKLEQLRSQFPETRAIQQFMGQIRPVEMQDIGTTTAE
jgi:hypothetical protein